MASMTGVKPEEIAELMAFLVFARRAADVRQRGAHGRK
jgi:hypothetical protein